MFGFKQMDMDMLSITKENWCEQVKNLTGEVYAIHYERLLGWMEQTIVQEGNNNNYIYCLTRENAPECACAILEISHARPNSNEPWLKVLSIYVEPNLEVSAGQDTDVSELSSVAAVSVVEALGLTFEELPSSQLKVYASTPLTLAFLEGVAAAINIQANIKLSVKTHGNWLVINKI